jgi:hypothetical protein
MSENSPATQASAPETKTLEERRAILNQQVSAIGGKGTVVTYENPTTALIVKPSNVNHMLHFVMSVFTLGVWAIIWLTLVILKREQKWRVSVNERGEVKTDRL